MVAGFTMSRVSLNDDVYQHTTPSAKRQAAKSFNSLVTQVVPCDLWCVNIGREERDAG